MSRGGPRAGLGVEDGRLCRLLRSPDYNLFPRSAVFESDFLQVTRTGSCVDIHNAATPVTLGVTSSDPCLPLPNVLVLARGGSPPERPALTLSRVLPLRLVQLSVPAGAGRLLRLRTATGKVHYLRLHPGHPDAVFALWVRLAHILRHGLSFTAAGSSAPEQPAPDGAGSSAVRVGAQLDGSVVRLSSRCFWPALDDPAWEEGAGVPFGARGQPAICGRCWGSLPTRPDAHHHRSVGGREAAAGSGVLSHLRSLAGLGGR